MTVRIENIDHGYNTFYNSERVYGGGFSTGLGEITDDPQYRRIGGSGRGFDFHLQNTSPAIDSGDPTANCIYESYPNGCRINMGSYGNTSEATPRPAGPGVRHCRSCPR